MWKLTIEDDEGKQTALPLAHDEYGLGRDEANAIRLTDRNISRKHATLRKNGHGWLIRDLSSYNGTSVNGVRVADEQLVQSGDVVQLGDYRLELLDEAAQTNAGADTAPMAVVPAHQRPDRLVVVVGPTPGTEYPLDRELFTVGRAEEATISINHSSVSRLHAELIALGGGRYEIIDKGSANGIRINGVELRRGIFEAGDALELGDVRLRFVGAGKMFRAGSEQSQQLRAVGTFESVAPSVRAPPVPAPSGGARGGIAKYIAIGALVGLIAILVVIAAMHSSADPAPAGRGDATVPSAATTAAGATWLDEARALARAGDLAGAHRALGNIADTSPLRGDPAFKEIEAAWADSIFDKAEAATDPTDKRALLNLIATTPTVDVERRTKAATLLQQSDPPPSPSATGLAVVAPAASEQPSPATATTAIPRPAGDVLPGGALDNESVRRSLGPKVWSGRASEAEIKALRAACSALGDRACRDRAAAMLKTKRDEGR